MAKRINYLIEFILHRSSVEQLKELYAWHLTKTAADALTEIEELLYEHTKDMYLRLEKMDRDIVNKGKLTLTSAEALAFYMYWNSTDTSAWPLATILINDMVMKIDKRSRRPRYAS